MSRTRLESRFLPLYAAFLWWVGVLAVQALLDAIGLGIELGLATQGVGIRTLFGLQIAERVLAMGVLWAAVAALFLRPGALAPGPSWLHPIVLALAVVLLLGSSAASMGLTTLRWVAIARTLTTSDVSWLAQHQQFLALGVRALQVLTWSGVAVGLWATLGTRPRD